MLSSSNYLKSVHQHRIRYQNTPHVVPRDDETFVIAISRCSKLRRLRSAEMGAWQSAFLPFLRSNSPLICPSTITARPPRRCAPRGDEKCKILRRLRMTRNSSLRAPVVRNLCHRDYVEGGAAICFPALLPFRRSTHLPFYDYRQAARSLRSSL